MTAPLVGDGSVLVAGHPSGEWGHVAAACAAAMPSAVVAVARRPFALPPDSDLASLRAAGVGVHWVLGSHLGDHVRAPFARLWPWPDGNLSGQVRHLGKLAIAGLGGTFRQEVWWPRTVADAPAAVTRKDCLDALVEGERWRRGLPYGLQDAVFPEDVACFGGLRADVPLSAEAPSCHPDGFAAVDRAAELLGARVVVHGHCLNRDNRWVLPSGTLVRGIGFGEVLRLRREDLP